MRKSAYFIAFISCLFLLVSYNRSLVFAQELAPTNWQCMAVKQTGGHTASLSTKEGNFFAPVGSNVYIVECVSSSDGNACSTGDTASDGVLGLSGMPGYTISNSFSNPVKATIDGKTEGESYVRTTDGPDSNHVYFGVQLTKDTVLSVSDATQKFGSFYPTNSDTNCVSLRWDPTGIVFDSKTLEPIPNVGMTIYNKDGSKLNLAGVPNPYNTRENGQYNFNVEPNKFYSMTAQSSSHTFPSLKIILPAQNDPDFPYTGIYKGGLFFETPKILRLDIPVDSTIPFVRDVKITDWKSRLDKPLNLLIIDGGVTHPFSKIKVYNASKLVGSGIADQYGKFIVSVESTLIDNSQDLELTAEKADVYNRVQNVNPTSGQNFLRGFLHNLIPEAYAQTSEPSIKIKPILNYLDGFAFDSDGNIIPKATVQIVLTVATKPSYQTRADDKGYFRISSEYIPPLPYNIVITSPSGVTSILSTTEFASFNKEKSEGKQTNYGQYRTVSNSYTTPTSEPDSLTATNSGTNNSGVTGNSGDNVNTGNQTSGEKPTETKNNSLTGLFLLIIFLTVSGGCALFLYKKKKAIKENTEKTSDQEAS